MFFLVNPEIDLLEADGPPTTVGSKAPWPLPKNVSKPEAASRLPQLVHADCEAGIVGKPAVLKL